ncbi:MAG: isopentenyl phosphate kinase [Candidatus ainarchaeum sp.]|nr:isopentenyl phosphate kinase [Candidatus ainarchaeum sp.]
MKALKIGGSVITDKKGYKKANPKNIELMAQTVAEAWKKGMRDFVLVHGAGSFGHAVVLKHGINDGIKDEKQKLGYADTHAACAELSSMLVTALIAEGVPAISIPPAAILRQSNKRISDFRFDVVHGYLSAGYLPVLYGDMVPDRELGGSVCSGDQIMAFLGKHTEFLVFVTDVDGVLDDKGKIIPLITNANFNDVSKHLKEKKNDVTGAMKGKISELLALDTVSYIVNGAKPERVISVLKGEPVPSTKIMR